ITIYNCKCVSGGLPYLILIITLVLCSILLATIALIIIVVVTRQKRSRRQDSLEDTAISYDDLAKPGLTAMEVQPDMRSLEPRGDPRAFMPFAPLPPRRFGPQGPVDSQRRLIPVPEEEGGSDEGRQSQENLFNFSAYEYNSGNLGDAEEEDVEYEAQPETQPGAAAAPLRHMRPAGFIRGNQRSLSNSGT
ncbi:unnamed protein product, partial [Candidula unifasciata]